MLTKYRARSIGEVFDAIREIRLRWNPKRSEEELWFRGDDKPYSLKPSLYRPRELNSRYDEVSLNEAFKATGAPIAPASVTNEWDWYFLARHHGLPTRLLDWSINATTALFFAIQPHMREKSLSTIDKLALAPGIRASYSKECPVLWVLEATSLNVWAVKTHGLIAVSPLLDSMLPDSLDDTRRRKKDDWPNRRPLAIVPRHSNARLVAQGGRFTIHGRERTSIDGICRRERGVKLACISLSQPHLARMWDDLDTAGVNVSTVMKDLDSLAAYLKHTFDQSESAK